MDPYKILGVDKHATQDEIRRAYHRQAARHHPDAGGEQWAFEQVRTAYEQLTGKATKAGGQRHERKPPKHYPKPTKSSPAPPRHLEQQTWATDRIRKRRQLQKRSLELLKLVAGGIVGLSIGGLLLWFAFDLYDFGDIDSIAAETREAAKSKNDPRDRIVEKRPKAEKLEPKPETQKREKPDSQANRTLPIPATAIRTVIERYLEENANDPDKVQIVTIGEPVATSPAYKWMGGVGGRSDMDAKRVGLTSKGYWEPIQREGVAVLTKFRSTNALGALVLDERFFCISGNIVFDVIQPQDFLPNRPKDRPDPFTDQFMRSLPRDENDKPLFWPADLAIPDPAEGAELKATQRTPVPADGADLKATQRDRLNLYKYWDDNQGRAIHATVVRINRGDVRFVDKDGKNIKCSIRNIHSDSKRRLRGWQALRSYFETVNKVKDEERGKLTVKNLELATSPFTTEREVVWLLGKPTWRGSYGEPTWRRLHPFESIVGVLESVNPGNDRYSFVEMDRTQDAQILLWDHEKEFLLLYLDEIGPEDRFGLGVRFYAITRGLKEDLHGTFQYQADANKFVTAVLKMRLIVPTKPYPKAKPVVE